MRYSVVIPFYNERDAVPLLMASLQEVLQRLAASYELILVDDGSTDGTGPLLDAVSLEPVAQRTVIRFGRHRGQAEAMQAGLDRATGEVVIMLDGDGQDDPRDIPLLLKELESGYDIVCGWRIPRADGWLKRASSGAANGIRRILFGERIHDVGCTFRVMTSRAAHAIRLEHGMHRFATALWLRQGYRIGETKIHHHPRRSGQSKYNFYNRLFPGLVGLLRMGWISAGPLWAAVCVGSFLRFYQLGAESFWVDEVTTMTLAGQPISQIILDRIQRGHSPFYFVLMRFWVQLAGTGEAAARFPSALLGIASIVLVYRLAKTLFDSKTGWISAWIFSVSILQIGYSQEARMYSAALFLSLASALCLIRALRTSDKHFWIATTLLAALALATSPSMVPVLFSQGLFAAAQSQADQRTRKQVRISAAVLLALCGPGLILLAVLSRGTGMFWSLLDWPLWFDRVSYFWISFLSVTPPNVSLPQWGSWLWTVHEGAKIFMTGLIGFSLAVLWKDRSREGPRWVLLSFGFPFVILLILSFIVRLAPRYLLFSSAALAIGMAAALVRLPWRTQGLPLLVLISFISLAGVAVYFREQGKPPWREAAAYVERVSRSDQEVWAYPEYVSRCFRYYDKARHSVRSVPAEDVTGWLPREKEFWLITQGPLPQGMIQWVDRTRERRQTWVSRSHSVQVILYGDK